jgi:hypothetical protein
MSSGLFCARIASSKNWGRVSQTYEQLTDLKKVSPLNPEFRVEK